LIDFVTENEALFVKYTLAAVVVNDHSNTLFLKKMGQTPNINPKF